jgi:hypothetical protein
LGLIGTMIAIHIVHLIVRHRITRWLWREYGPMKRGRKPIGDQPMTGEPRGERPAWVPARRLGDHHTARGSYQTRSAARRRIELDAPR